MTAHTDDWDDEEREALAEVRHELEAMRRRHAGDPSLDVLGAARGQALPEPLQARMEAHLASSEWSRAQLDGAELPDAPLDDHGAARILAKVKRDAGIRDRGRPRWVLPIVLGGALAASLTVAVLLWPQSAAVDVVPDHTATPQVAESGPAPPAFALEFEKPDVRLDLASLTWRGAGNGDGYLADLKPALDAYRADDFAAAAAAFDALAGRYPDAVEVHFYGGISRLYLDQAAEAVTSLTKAAAVASDAFADKVAFHLAVAEHRSGDTEAARARLDRLCGQDGAATEAACAALASWNAAIADPPDAPR